MATLADKIRAEYTLPQSFIDEMVECISNCGRIGTFCTHNATSGFNGEWFPMKYKPILIKWAEDNGFNVTTKPSADGKGEIVWVSI